MEKSISILLGAGFSKPMGYPIGNEINKKLLNLKAHSFIFDSNGNIQKPSALVNHSFNNKTRYDFHFEFCVELIGYYDTQIKPFNYEEFYDYLLNDVEKDINAKEVGKKFEGNLDWYQLVSGLPKIFNQLVAYFIKDKNENQFYDNEAYKMDYFYPGYTGFLNILKSIDNETIVNIHTLNHDLFFESLNNTSFLRNQICDGFEELGSPYFGELSINERTFKCRLQRYTGIYDKKFRLYKLHGSLDYVRHYNNINNLLEYDKHIKIRNGISFDKIFKEIINTEGKLEYENCWINYHPDFLTGTTSKIIRYKEPFYTDLFEKFRTNLKSADKLIIIGYGARDSEINKLIYGNFEFGNKKAYIIDPYAGDAVKEFKKMINAKLITSQLENITNSDLE